jgi:hypothetical protein
LQILHRRPMLGFTAGHSFMMMAALQAAQAATSASSLRGLLSRRERHRKNLRHQNRLKNNRKIVARRTRAPHPCHQRCDNNKSIKSVI